jgi:hypothetical protein
MLGVVLEGKGDEGGGGGGGGVQLRVDEVHADDVCEVLDMQ